VVYAPPEEMPQRRHAEATIVERARRITERLMTRQAMEQLEQVSVIDIQGFVGLFDADKQILRAAGSLAPATVISGRPCVVSLDYLARLDPHLQYFMSLARLLGSTVQAELGDTLHRVFSELLGRGSSLPLHEVTLDEADALFEQGVEETVQGRLYVASDEGKATFESLAGKLSQLNLQMLQGGGRTAVPGCNFHVTSQSSGLRVYWSPAYYITPNYFGAPTSPATSVMQAGSYVFGVDGAAYATVQWDNAVCTLPGRNSIHLNY
jgi:hypothetical protein